MSNHVATARLARTLLVTTALVACGSTAVRGQTAAPQPQVAAGANNQAAGAAAPAPAPDASSPATGEIVVTGSRVARSGFTAPTPTTVLGQAAIAQRGAINIAEALNDIPAFTPTTSTGTAGARPFAPGSNYANLRSLGPTRTLVLVNGRRFAPSVPSFGTVGANQVDLNLIPPILLERAEVVTGGASAQWGSDAVAGVVNLILDTHYKGLQIEAENGISQRGDNSETRASAKFGTAFAGERGHFVVAGEYYRNGGVGDIYTRGWGRKDSQIVANPSPATNGLPRFVISDNVRLSTMTPGGIITAGPLKGTVFGPGGTTSQFTYGTLAGSLFMIDGGTPNYGLANGLLLVPKMRRYTGFAHGEYELADRVTAFVEASYGRTESNSIGIQPRDAGTITIQVSNPFLPATVKQRAVTAGITSFAMGRMSDDLGQIRINVQNDNFRVATGLNGELGGGWKWDSYYQFGENIYNQQQWGQRINANFTQAVDAVKTASGQIVCRSSLTNPSNGCVPINIFGSGSPSADAIKYVTGDSVTRTLYIQHVAAANLHGEPFSTWAGPVSVAMGAEHRYERQTTTADALSQADAFNQQNPKALEGHFSVTEGYFETVVPLARNLTLAKKLDLNAAVRVADYNTVGTAVTWKSGLSWTVTDWLLLRGTRSRDIRAPNIFELHAAPTPTLSNINDPVTNTQVSVRQYLSGNPDLKEEVASTLTVGAVLTPTFVPRFQLAVDYYSIDLKDAITSVQGNGTVSICAATKDPFFCGNIIRNAAGVITRINSPYVNLGRLKSQGLDVEASYRLPVGPGSIVLRAIGTYTFRSVSNYGQGSIDRVGEVGTNNSGVNPIPRFRGTANVGYEGDGFRGNVQLNYIARGTYDATYVDGVDINNNTIPARLYTNLSIAKSIGQDRKFEIQLTINNLFDVDPPAVPSTTFFLPTNPAFYDTVGRDFRVGVKMRF